MGPRAGRCAAAYAAPEAMVHLSDDLAFLHRKYLVDCDVSLLFFSVEVLQGLTVELNSSNNVDSIPHLRTAEQRMIRVALNSFPSAVMSQRYIN